MKKSHRSSKSIGNLLQNNSNIQIIKTNKTSEALLEKMKGKKFTELFMMLDSN